MPSQSVVDVIRVKKNRRPPNVQVRVCVCALSLLICVDEIEYCGTKLAKREQSVVNRRHVLLFILIATRHVGDCIQDEEINPLTLDVITQVVDPVYVVELTPGVVPETVVIGETLYKARLRVGADAAPL